MTKLNQIVAVEKGVRTKSERIVTDAYQNLGKVQLFGGISRTYQPKDDEGDQLPPESTLVQFKADAFLADVAAAMTRLLDVAMTKEDANTRAEANVVVDGKILLADVPVTGLLLLEKRLTDIRTFVSKIPVLDPAKVWHYDEAAGAYATEPVQTHRSKKVPRVLVKAAATDKHPAQVDVWQEDVIDGYWSTTYFSGALPADRIKELLDRVDKVAAAVKFAREEANSIEITDVKVGKALFDYLFA